jgi:hypothetical protein
MAITPKDLLKLQKIAQGGKRAATTVKDLEVMAQLEALGQAPLTAADRARVGKLAAEATKKQTPTKMSEALGNVGAEGKKIRVTQTDRTAAKYLGGAPFSMMQEVDPRYADIMATWGVKTPSAATNIINQSDPDIIWSTLIGAPTQHRSNELIFNKLYKEFQKSAKEGNLSPELRARFNAELEPLFGEGADILDPNFRKSINTFEERAAVGNLLLGKGIGGELRGGSIIPGKKIMDETTEPMLRDVETFSIGPRLFTLNKGVVSRPDIHPAFPEILQGEDLKQLFIPAPNEIALPTFNEEFRKRTGRKKAGYYDLTATPPGEPYPTQFVDDKYLTHLQKEGYADGGVIHMAGGSDVTKAKKLMDIASGAKKVGTLSKAEAALAKHMDDLLHASEEMNQARARLPLGTDAARAKIEREFAEAQAKKDALYKVDKPPVEKGNKALAEARRILSKQPKTNKEKFLEEEKHPSIPDVLYHGTKREFSSFEPKYDDGLSFFSTNPEFASKWPRGSGGLRANSLENEEHYKELRGVEEQIAEKYREEMPDYDDPNWAEKYDSIREKIKQEMRDKTGFDSASAYESNAGIQVMPVHLAIKKPFDPRTDYKEVEGLLNSMSSMTGIVDKGLHKTGNWVVYERPEVVNHLKSKGYDGMWLSENTDGPHETLAPFDSRQIKSAIGNRGTYDINEADITKAHGGVVHMAEGSGVTRPRKYVPPSQLFPLKTEEPSTLGALSNAASNIKDAAKEEGKTFGDKGATMDIINRGPVADVLGGFVDLANLPLQGLDYLASKIPAFSKPASVMEPEGERVSIAPVSSDEPFGGSEAWRKQFQKSGVTSMTERPLTEMAVSLASPFAPFAAGKALKAGKALAPTAGKLAQEFAEKTQFGMPLEMNVVPPSQAVGKAAEIKAPANDLGLYSVVEKASLNLQRKSGNGDAFLSDLMKNQGVSQARLDETGLTAALKGRKGVTREEVQQLAAEGKIPLEERVAKEFTEEPKSFQEHRDNVDRVNDKLTFYGRSIDTLKEDLNKSVQMYGESNVNASQLRDKIKLMEDAYQADL